MAVSVHWCGDKQKKTKEDKKNEPFVEEEVGEEEQEQEKQDEQEHEQEQEQEQEHEQEQEQEQEQASGDGKDGVTSEALLWMTPPPFSPSNKNSLGRPIALPSQSNVPISSSAFCQTNNDTYWSQPVHAGDATHENPMGLIAAPSMSPVSVPSEQKKEKKRMTNQGCLHSLCGRGSRQGTPGPATELCPASRSSRSPEWALAQRITIAYNTDVDGDSNDLDHGSDGDTDKRGGVMVDVACEKR
jgi:hypothetical protein